VLAPNLLEPLTSSPEQNAALTKADFARWAKVIRGANLKVDKDTANLFVELEDDVARRAGRSEQAEPGAPSVSAGVAPR
jgi:hypothetical protein